MSEKAGIVADGWFRAWRELEPTLRAEVEREFETELRDASEQQRRELRRRIEREVGRRLDRLAPQSALYLVRSSP